jgi:pyrroline-5-carboxylate reductase
MTALYAAPGVGAEDPKRAEAILGAAGRTVWVKDEGEIDAVTAISGSGPAYVFYFMEALQAAARELGLGAEEARRLSLQTFVGASHLAESGDDPAILRARVTSKGGTTERALNCMEDAELKRKFIEAVKQAAQRSRELGDQIGNG